MTAVRVWIARLLGTLAGRRREDELRDEIAQHLELLADEHRRRGLSDAEARLAARRAFGGIEQTRETFHDTRRFAGIEALLQDLRFAGRTLRRERGTTLAAIALLTVGVSATVVLADVLDRLLLRPPAYVDAPSRVRRLYVSRDGGPASEVLTNYVTMSRLAEATKRDIEALAAYAPERIGSGHGPSATRFEVIGFSEAYFDVLGIRPALGTLPSARSRSDVTAVVVSHAVWQSRFGGSPEVLGQALRLGRHTYSVVAVLPRGFAGVDEEPVDVWVPLESRRTDRDWRTTQSYIGMRLLARLRPGVDPMAAEAHATQVYNVVQRIDRPVGIDQDVQIVFGPLPPAQAPSRADQTNVLLAVAAVSALVLVMACGNVANLLILTGLRRTSELALKAALGASRGRLVREVLLQAVLLATGAGVAALAVTMTAGVLVRRAFLPPLAAMMAPLDGRLIVLTIGICAIVALLLGAAPAIRLSTLRMLSPGRNRLGRVPAPLLDAFVALQVAMSVPLLTGMGLFAISFWGITHVDIGWEPDRVVAIKANLLDDGRPADAHEAHRRIQARIATLPGVVSTAVAQSTPMQGGLARVFDVPGYTFPAGGYSMPMVNGVDPAFLDVMRMRVLEGRPFTEADNRPGAEPVTLVNEAMARVYWSGVSPIGRCIAVAGRECVRVVGVVAKASPFATLRGAASPMTMQYFVPLEAFRDLNQERVLLARTSEPTRRLLGRMRAEAQAAGADLPYVDASPLDEVLESQIAPLRLGWSVFLALSALAMAIAIAGLSVVTAHGVARRTREMGIRLVLGARPGDLVRLMIGRTLLAMTIGLVGGAILAYVGSTFLESVLFGIEPADPRVFAAAIAVLFVVGAGAAWIPARRTGHIDASAALRIE